jgi:hypothetical protein
VRKLSNQRGLEIVEQGRKQFMAMFDESACPFKLGTVEHKLWMKGYIEARVKWFKPFEDRKRFAKFVRKPFAKPFKK